MARKTYRLLGRAVLSLCMASLVAFGAGQPAAAGGGGLRIYVNASATGANNGTSWMDAYKSLQVALTAATSGYQIWVAKGTYKPAGGIDRSKTFSLKNGVAIYGGFAGGETLLSQRKPAVNVTILSGEIGSAGTSDNSYHVVSGSSIGSTAVLDGFTVTGGNADGPEPYGGGMYDSSFASPTLKNLTFVSNATSFYGGGLYNGNGSSPTLGNVKFISNKAGSGGGGLFNYFNSSPTLTDVTFRGNSSVTGGGMYTYSSVPKLSRVTFSGNNATSIAGAMYNSSSNTSLVNVTFSGNAAHFGGGVYNLSSSPTFTDVTFSGNSASSQGGGMYNDNSAPHIFDSIFWGDGTDEIHDLSSPATIANSIVQGGCPFGATCTAVSKADPKLGPLHSNGGLTQTRAPGSGSAAIDKGNNSTCAAKDQRGVHRPQGPACDMGAFEVKVLSLVSTAANDGWVLESAENSNSGGSSSSTEVVLRVGDEAFNRQYRGIVSFGTAALPDTSGVIKVVLRLKFQGFAGANPFTKLGKLGIDVTKPYFGTGPALQLADFQASATASAAGVVGSAPSAGWYTGSLNSVGRGSINKTGTTQLRLRFSLDDNNNLVSDYVAFYSGNATTAADRPVLRIYYVP